jgi:hypothetical protein
VNVYISLGMIIFFFLWWENIENLSLKNLKSYLKNMISKSFDNVVILNKNWLRFNNQENDT